MLKRTNGYRRLAIAVGIIPAAGIALAGAGRVSGAHTAKTQRFPVVFSGGHDTDPDDNGRPVILIAGALGVSPETFRYAFSRVHPAPPGVQPSPDEQRANKAALMAVLAPYGITNDRLDQVSNYYRYQRSMGQMWPTRPAKAYLIAEDGYGIRYVVTDGGCGYTSAPSFTAPGIQVAGGGATLSFSKDFAHNGAVASMSYANYGLLKGVPNVNVMPDPSRVTVPPGIPPPPPPPITH